MNITLHLALTGWQMVALGLYGFVGFLFWFMGELAESFLAPWCGKVWRVAFEGAE